MLLVHLPNRKRNTQLGVVAARRTDHIELVVQQLIKKLLHNGLAVASRNTNHRDVETFPVVSGQSLQGTQRVLHQQEVGLWHTGELRTQLAHHEVAYPQLIKILNETMPVVGLSDQGKEQTLLREREATTICQ